MPDHDLYMNNKETDKIWKEIQEESDKVIIFDWDDTLLASSWITKCSLRPVSTRHIPCIQHDQKKQLEELEEAVVSLLKRACNYGKVVIITAAESGWVELSASLYLPGTLPLIQSSIKVVSARSNFEEYYPDCPLQWKIAAFSNELYNVFGSSKTMYHQRHLLSFGDSSHEREALLEVVNHQDLLYGKSLKFIAHPTIEELKQQIQLVIGCFEYLCSFQGALDLRIFRNQTDLKIDLQSVQLENQKSLNSI